MPRSYSIFLVDDHQALLDGLRSALHEFQHISVVGEASSYDNAYDQISGPSFHADVVITDYILGSKFDGIDLCRAAKLLRADQRVVLLTMHDSAALRYRAQRASVDRHITKSSPISEIVLQLDALMDGHKPGSGSLLNSTVVAPAATPTTTELSSRELEVLRLITCEELTTKQIAERLHRSVQTIEAHRAHLFQKLGVDSVVGLVKYAMSINLCTDHREPGYSGNS